MNLLAKLDELYLESKGNRWLRYFAVFCRVALALGFIPSGIVKVLGQRFTGLPSNHPLGHYFDELQRTGFYYTFIGVSQLTNACADNARPEACKHFCECIYDKGHGLDECLEEYGKGKKERSTP